MRRNQLTLILILVGVVFWVGLSSWRAHLKTRTPDATSSAIVTSAAAPAAPSSQLPAQVQPASVAGGIDSRELEFKLPDRTTYLAQVAESENQEGVGVPPVLREFSVRMAELMEKASQSPEFAAALFDRLKGCVGAKRGTTIHQVRTICAVNALRLGEIHPQTLGNQAKALRASLPARLKTRVVTLGF